MFLVLMSHQRLRLVSDIINAGLIEAEDRVLDVGTGRGFLAVEIAKAVPGARVVGIDIWNGPAKGQVHKGFVTGNSKTNAERNATLEGVSDRVEFKQCDAREMPFERRCFDVAVSSLALHQMFNFGAEGRKVLQEIYRVLKPGGRLVDVDVMIGRSITEKLRELGFKEIEVRNIRNLGRPSFFLKMLTAIKGN